MRDGWQFVVLAVRVESFQRAGAKVARASPQISCRRAFSRGTSVQFTRRSGSRVAGNVASVV